MLDLYDMGEPSKYTSRPAGRPESKSFESSSFEKWCRGKTIERGMKIIKNIENSDITKQEIEDKLILAAVAIDCTCGILDVDNRTRQQMHKKSMKFALWKWMSANHTFHSLPLNEVVEMRFSSAGRQMYIIPKEQGRKMERAVLRSCSYQCINLKQANNYDDTFSDNCSDQKIINRLFSQQFQIKWEESRHRLHAMCKADLMKTHSISSSCSRAEAEPKTIQYFDDTMIKGINSSGGYFEGSEISSKVAKSDDIGESKAFGSRAHSCSKDSKRYSTFQSVLEPQRNRSPHVVDLTPDTYGVSKACFDKYLQFGMNYLIEVKKRIANANTENSNLIKKERIKEAKRTHEKWLDLKYRERTKTRKAEAEIRKKKNAQAEKQMKEKRSFGRNLKGYNRQRISCEESPKFPPKPNIWATESTDSSCITIQWSSDDDVDYFSLSLYKDKKSGPLQNWRDPEISDGTFLLKKTVYLHPGDNYIFGISCTSSAGPSTEARIEIISKPEKPGKPILRQATDNTLDVCWRRFEKEDVQHSDKSTRLVETLPKRFDRNISYIIESCPSHEQSQRWQQIWKGSAKIAKLKGFVENSSYKLRIQACIGEIRGLHGEPRIFHTIPKTPDIPQILTGQDPTNRATVLLWDVPDPSKKDNHRGSEYVSVIKSCRISLKQYFSELDKDHCGRVKTIDLLELLKILNINTSVDDFNIFLTLLEKEFGDQIFFDQFVKIWTTYKVFILRMTEENNKCEKKNVYSGTDCRTTIDGLSPSTRYNFDLQQITVRGQSRFSSPITINTLPESPVALYMIHSYGNETILKVQISASTFFKVNLEIRDESAGSNQWTSIFTGKSTVIKVPFLRPHKKYKFKCCLVNKENKKGGQCISSFEIRKDDAICKLSGLMRLFSIDCSGADAIIEGDMIIFTESFIEKNDVYDRSIAARVIQKDKVNMKLEVAWVSNKKDADIAIGSMLKRSNFDILNHEVLRMAWIDECDRLKSLSELL